ncbi:DUF4114 domain-containing protein [Dongia mobilis]|uniref:DUF4114 domain-containing protein n=1 Tax=Dongia sp. TaxID=1977262 RepID=UPI0026EF0D68
MAQLVKLGDYLVEIDGTRLVFFDANGNQKGAPQDLADAEQIALPDGTAIPAAQFTELLAGDIDALANFQTAAGAPAGTELPGTEVNSGGGRFATFEGQDGIGGFTAVGGLNQTELKYQRLEADPDDQIIEAGEPEPVGPQGPAIIAEGGSVDFHITRISSDQNPIGDMKVGDYLTSGGKEGRAIDPGIINGVSANNLTLAESVEVKVGFVSEGAGYKSMVGVYAYDADGKIDPDSLQFLWLDATQTNQNVVGGALAKDFLGNSQPMEVSLGNLPADTKLGFFIIADGASSGANQNLLKGVAGVDGKGNDYAKDLDAINSQLSFKVDGNGNGQVLVSGKRLSGNIYFTHDKTLNTDSVGKDIEHTLSGVPAKADGKLYVGFEDLAGGGDRDYQDVVISVEIGQYNVNKLTQTATQPSVDLSDVDSTHLASVVITTAGFHAGDMLNLPANALFDVQTSHNGNDMVFTVTAKNGAESVETFEDFLNHTYFSTANTDEGDRTISYQAIDSDGMSSNVADVAVHVSATFEISVSELNGIDHFGSSDDTLHLNQGLSGAFDMGAGEDTVHLARTGMSFGHGDAQKLDNVEVLDAQGAGNNKVSISIDDVLDLTDGDHRLTILGEAGDTLTLTGDGGHSWTVTDQGADFTTYSYNDGIHQAVVEVSNQMAQTIV